MKKMNANAMRKASGGIMCMGCRAKFSNNVIGSALYLLHKPLCFASF